MAKIDGVVAPAHDDKEKLTSAQAQEMAPSTECATKPATPPATLNVDMPKSLTKSAVMKRPRRKASPSPEKNASSIAKKRNSKA